MPSSASAPTPRQPADAQRAAALRLPENAGTRSSLAKSCGDRADAVPLDDLLCMAGVSASVAKNGPHDVCAPALGHQRAAHVCVTFVSWLPITVTLKTGNPMRAVRHGLTCVFSRVRADDWRVHIGRSFGKITPRARCLCTLAGVSNHLHS